jgi:dihydrolipoamide dehydrogenase
MAEEFGIKAPVQELDLQAIVARKNGVSGDIQMGMEGLLGNNSVEVVRGQAVLKSPTEVNVEDTILKAKKIILATGSSLSVPAVPGLEEAALTTDQVLEMTEVPSSVLIWGSLGPIEVEMATLLNISTGPEGTGSGGASSLHPGIGPEGKKGVCMSIIWPRRADRGGAEDSRLLQEAPYGPSGTGRSGRSTE